MNNIYKTYKISSKGNCLAVNNSKKTKNSTKTTNGIQKVQMVSHMQKNVEILLIIKH